MSLADPPGAYLAAQTAPAFLSSFPLGTLDASVGARATYSLIDAARARVSAAYAPPCTEGIGMEFVLVAIFDDALIDVPYPSSLLLPFPKSLARVRARQASPSGPTAQEPEAAEEPSQTPMAAAARGRSACGEESWAKAAKAAAPASEERRVLRRDSLLSLSDFALVEARGAVVGAAGGAAATAVDPLRMMM